jgi:hypothetical protein
MKISLADVANFGTGFLTANQKNTENNLKLRQEQLKADRDFYLAQKKDKYAAELALYKNEKEKAAEITRLNEEVKNNKLGQEAYAAQYLMTTLGVDKYKLLQSQPETLNKMISDINETKDYKFSLNRDLIDKQAQVDTATINKVFAEEMKSAKGDDVLVNKVRGLLGMKQNATENVQDNLNKQLEAAKLVEKVVDQRSELSGIALSKTDSKTIFVPKLFKDEAQKLRTKLNENTEIKKENINIGLTFFTENNIPVSDQYLTKDKDGNVTGLKGAGRTFINQTNLLSSQAIKDFTNEKLYLGTGKEASLISNKLNPNVIYRLTAERLADYSIATAEKNFFTKRDNMVAIVPFSVVSTDNILAGKYQFTNKAQTKLVGQAYLDVIKDITNEQNPNASIESKQKFMNDIQNKLLSADITTDNKLVIDVQNKIINKLQLETSKTTEPASTSTGVEAIVYQGKRIPLTDANKKALTGMNFDWENAPKVSTPNMTTSKPAPTPVDVDEEYTTGTEFNVVPQKPVSQMTREERRAYDKKKRDEQMKLMEDRRKSFNTKVRNINQQSSNTNTIDFNADK